MKLLLISNSTQFGRGYLDHCADAMREFLDGRRRLLFIPFAVQNWDAYTASVRERLRRLGLEVRGVHEGEAEDGLQWCQAVFTGGGNTFRLLDTILQTGLLEPLRERVLQGLPYLGSSAGTNLACPTIMTTNDMPIVYPPSFKALNVIPFQINPHYVDPEPGSRHQGETREVRIREFLELHSRDVLGLREGSWLRREQEQLVLKGESAARLFQRHREPREFRPGTDLSFLLGAPGSEAGLVDGPK